VAGEKSLRGSGRSKALHLALASSDWDVRTFSAAVQSLASYVNVGKIKLAERGIA
jgi:hypothetical protein